MLQLNHPIRKTIIIRLTNAVITPSSDGPLLPSKISSKNFNIS